jgi:hypothetical protein
MRVGQIPGVSPFAYCSLYCTPCPGCGASRSAKRVAVHRIRDRPKLGACCGPGSAAHHYAPLRSASLRFEPRPGHIDNKRWNHNASPRRRAFALMERVRTIDGGVTVGDLAMPPKTHQRREHHERIGHAIAFTNTNVLIVISHRLSRPGGNRRARSKQSQGWQPLFTNCTVSLMTPRSPDADSCPASVRLARHVPGLNISAGHLRSYGMHRRGWPDKPGHHEGRSLPSVRYSTKSVASKVLITKLNFTPKSATASPFTSAKMIVTEGSPSSENSWMKSSPVSVTPLPLSRKNA